MPALAWPFPDHADLHDAVRPEMDGRTGPIPAGTQLLAFPGAPAGLKDRTMIRGILLLLACLLAGEGFARLTGLPLPGGVLGMALLWTVLRTGAVSEPTVRPAADTLLRHMPLFFVPAGVGVVRYGSLLQNEWLPIVVASVASTLVVLALVGTLQQRLGRS